MIKTRAKKWRFFLFAAAFLWISALIVSRYPTNGKETEDEMVRVPTGEFVMGSNEEGAKALKSVFGEKTSYEDSKGQRTIYVEGFSIDKYEVTNRQYRKFIEATHYPRIPDHWQQNGALPPPGEEDLPVTFVSWYDAKAYAQWAGKRLPTEQEWEKAARGTDGRRFPWGMEFDKGKANTWESWGGSTGKVKPVGTYKGGASPYGAYDMTGNVMEWTATEIKRYSQSRDDIAGQREELPLIIVRGGGWSSDGVDGSTFSRTITEPYIRSGGVGFRCAK